MEIGTQDIRPIRSQDKATCKEATPSPQEEQQRQDGASVIGFRNVYILPPFYIC